jgi:hypothetical protein
MTHTPRPNIDVEEVKLQFAKFFSLASCCVLISHSQLASTSDNSPALKISNNTSN